MRVLPHPVPLPLGEGEVNSVSVDGGAVRARGAGLHPIWNWRGARVPLSQRERVGVRENGSQCDQRPMDFGIIGPVKIAQPLRAGLESRNGWKFRRDERKWGGSFVPAGLMAHAVADPSPQGLGYFQKADRLTDGWFEAHGEAA